MKNKMAIPTVWTNSKTRQTASSIMVGLDVDRMRMLRRAMRKEAASGAAKAKKSAQIQATLPRSVIEQL